MEVSDGGLSMPVVDELPGDVFGDFGSTLNEFDSA